MKSTARLFCFDMADVSTSHITAGDRELILLDQAPYLWCRKPDPDCCWSVFVVNHDSLQDHEAQIETMRAFGFSQHFLDRIQVAYKQAFDYIKFDADGPEYEDLPQFDGDYSEKNKVVTVRGLTLQFDVTTNLPISALDLARDAVEQINLTLQRQPSGLGAQLLASGIDASDVKICHDQEDEVP